MAEESLHAALFPEAASTYRRRVKAYVPFLR